jgi:aryl-alcohol dehydrogenase-like predicted oxidoreductase
MKRASTPLILGTAQLGLDYGIANAAGRPSEAAAVTLLRTAIAAGVCTLDTARAYGLAEERIGKALDRRGQARPRVITKLDPLSALSDTAGAKEVNDAVEASLAASREALRCRKLDVLLLHRAAHLDNPLIRLSLARAQSEGAFGQFGVSIQTPEEGMRALREPAVGVLQMPFNLLDRRWRDSGFLDRLKETRRTRNLEIHVRSVYLQGLLAAADPRAFPLVARVDPAAVCAFVRAAASALGRPEPSALAMAYVRGQSWIDGIVVGQENEAQLHANLAAFEAPPLLASEMREIEAAVPVLPDKLLNPALWPKKGRAIRAA